MSYFYSIQEYQSESERVYRNHDSNSLISPNHANTNQSDKARKVSKHPENPLKISGLPTKNSCISAVAESTHGSQIYTFREQNKNDEYFKSNKTEKQPDNEMNESDFVTGYFSPDESA